MGKIQDLICSITRKIQDLICSNTGIKQDFICPITGKKQDFAQLQKKLEKIVVKYRKNRKQLADNVRQTISKYL